MPNEEQEKEPVKLSYELLLKQLEEQNKKIAKQQEEIEDLKAVVKANFTTSKDADDSEEKKKTNKEEFEKRLKEDLKLC